MRALLAASLLFAPPAAHAYLPPSHYVYTKLGDQKPKVPVTGVALTIARPQSGGTEEILGTLTITDWKPVKGGWPGLTILFHNDAESLVRSAEAFGLDVVPEAQLLRVERTKLYSMKEAPDPFYRFDPTMSLKRTRQTYAWVHSNLEAGRSLWVEKDTFLPLKIAAPCPAPVASLGWAKAGEGKCELEFRNLYALRRGNFQSARMVLWKDGAPLLFFSFDHLASAKAKLAPSDGKLPDDVKEIAETILH